MTTPVDTEEIFLRIKAFLRRSQVVSEHMLTIGQVTLNYDALTITCGKDSQTLALVV